MTNRPPAGPAGPALPARATAVRAQVQAAWNALLEPVTNTRGLTGFAAFETVLPRADRLRGTAVTTDGFTYAFVGTDHRTRNTSVELDVTTPLGTTVPLTHAALDGATPAQLMAYVEAGERFVDMDKGPLVEAVHAAVEPPAPDRTRHSYSLDKP